MIQFENEKETAVIQPKMKNFNNKDYFDYAGASGGFLDECGCHIATEEFITKLKKIIINTMKLIIFRHMEPVFMKILHLKSLVVLMKFWSSF